MQVAVTDHAVGRYRQRVPKVELLEDEAARTLIRDIAIRAIKENRLRDHPGDYPQKRLVAFNAGGQQMYLTLGPNDTSWPGEWAVTGVIFSREVEPKGIGTLGDLIDDETKQKLAETVATTPKKRAKYLVRIGAADELKQKGEVYPVLDDEELMGLLQRRLPRPEDVEIFERREYVVRQVYTLDKK